MVDSSESSGDFPMAAAGLPAPPVLSSESDGDFAPAQAAPNVAAPPNPSRARRFQTAGSFAVLLVDATQVGADDDCMLAIGFALMSWELCLPDLPRDDPQDCGVIEYNVDKVRSFVSHGYLPADLDVSSPLTPARAVEALMDQPMSRGGTLATALVQENATCVEILQCSDAEMDNFFELDTTGGSAVFLRVPVHQRAAPRVLANAPEKALLRRWRTHVSREDLLACRRADAECRRVRPPAGEGLPGSVDFGPLLYVPPNARAQSDLGSRQGRGFLRAECDPVKLVHALSICSHIKDIRYFPEVVDDSYEYTGLGDDGEGMSMPERRREKDPRRTALQEAMAKADVVCCSLSR